MSKRRREITPEEWEADEWVEVTGFGDTEPSFIRGRRRSHIPGLRYLLPYGAGAWPSLSADLLYLGGTESAVPAPDLTSVPKRSAVEELDAQHLERWERELAKRTPPTTDAPEHWEPWL